MKCHKSSHQQAILGVPQVTRQLSGHHSLSSAMHKKLGLLYEAVHLQHLVKTRAETGADTRAEKASLRFKLNFWPHKNTQIQYNNIMYHLRLNLENKY